MRFIKDMNPIKTILGLCAVALLFVTPVSANADVARPSPSPQKPKVVLRTSLVIVPDSKATEARLQISQSSLAELRAALANTPENESIAHSITRSSTRTTIAGLFLFLSLSFAGVWLARSVQTKGQKVVVALLIGVAVIGAAAIITRANAGPPSSFFWRQTSAKPEQGKSDERQVRY